MSGKAIAYFFFGFLAGLLVVELTDGKPSKKANQKMKIDGIDQSSNKPYSLETDVQQDTFNNQRPNNSSGSSRRNN
tara:strand:+ start:1077 stop:1304 length:228 start_codon:yes stop_codon:yes gene_type:complete